MIIDRTLWYLIAFFGFITLSFIFWVVKNFIPNPKIFFSKHILYPPLFYHRCQTTRLQALIIFIFLSLNILLILVPIYPFPGWILIQKRAALASIINIVPLCMGGRAPIIDALNISRQFYFMAHAWLGAIATVEAVLHSIIPLLHDRNHYSLAQNNLLLSGWIVGGLLLNY